MLYRTFESFFQNLNEAHDRFYLLHKYGVYSLRLFTQGQTKDF